jgi:ribosomal protein S18 acetylase RimI-like enzyme
MVSLNEINELQKIGKQTFVETFSSVNSEENMRLYLEKSFATEKLKIELSDINSVFYFAVFNATIIGYLKVNFGASQTEIKDENVLEIERIYVYKEFHGQQVGQLLFEKAISISKQKNVDYVCLGVWEENRRAVRFYQKNGFVTFDKHIFRLGNEEQTDLMMKLTKF